MPRIAVTTPYFDFFPELKAELAAAYPDTRFRTERRPLTEDELIEYVAGCDTAIIGLDRFSDRVCAALPELKVISLCSAGVDHIDPAILKKHGKRMWWAAGINKISVSELAVCYMVLAVRRLHVFSGVLARGEWKGPIGFGTDLRGRTVGIHGCGHIGKEVVKLLQPYGVKILACDRVDYSDFYRQYGVEKVDADELWARSDVLTIHLSRNTTTIGMYSAQVLDRMKPGAVLVNCARGGMVDEVALKARLESGHIAGAAFDVFAVEPANGNPLLDVPNFFGSPHIGATTRESWEAMLRSGIRGIKQAYEPQPGVYPFD
ncbi:MAG TPA: NAD(P)-dependent oxidoreductase [Hyphomicrobiaceae bacterium]|nr:NAD(P)-dependent oxidoreductase [Hyphomicrobiaceae bacterium]